MDGLDLPKQTVEVNYPRSGPTEEICDTQSWVVVKPKPNSHVSVSSDPVDERAGTRHSTMTTPSLASLFHHYQAGPQHQEELGWSSAGTGDP